MLEWRPLAELLSRLESITVVSRPRVWWSHSDAGNTPETPPTSQHYTFFTTTLSQHFSCPELDRKLCRETLVSRTADVLFVVLFLFGFDMRLGWVLWNYIPADKGIVLWSSK